MVDIKLNHDEWNRLSQDVKDQIIQILERTGLLKEGDRITTEANAPTFSDLLTQKKSSSSEDFCKALCDAAEAAGLIGCEILGDPEKIADCKAVVIEAGNTCRRACKYESETKEV